MHAKRPGMRRLYPVSSVFALCLLVSSCAMIGLRKPPDLGWLEGCWSTSSGKTTECWRPDGNRKLAGASRTFTGDDHFRETLRIYRRKGKYHYVAAPDGQAETIFTEAEIDDRKIVFENPDHDFPQRIAYELTDDGLLRATISLADGSNQRVWDYQQVQIIPSFVFTDDDRAP